MLTRLLIFRKSSLICNNFIRSPSTMPSGVHFFSFLLILTLSSQSFKSMMALFQTPCPSGWTQLTFNNQFIRIAGGSFPVNSTGGKINITLYVENLPPHRHNIGNSGWDHHYGGGWYLGLRQLNQDDICCPFYQNAQTETVGQGKPFDNTPEYIAFNLCQLNQELELTINDSQGNLNISAIKQSIELANARISILENSDKSNQQNQISREGNRISYASIALSSFSILVQIFYGFWRRDQVMPE